MSEPGPCTAHLPVCFSLQGGARFQYTPPRREQLQGVGKRSRGFVNGSERATVTAEFETSPLPAANFPPKVSAWTKKSTRLPAGTKTLLAIRTRLPSAVAVLLAISLRLPNAALLLFLGHKSGQRFPCPGRDEGAVRRAACCASPAPCCGPPQASCGLVRQPGMKCKPGSSCRAFGVKLSDLHAKMLQEHYPCQQSVHVTAAALPARATETPQHLAIRCRIIEQPVREEMKRELLKMTNVSSSLLAREKSPGCA